MSTPIKFKELTIKNFMSYGNNVTTINLDFNEPKLIVGKNHDAIVNGQIDSNGAGKSAILDALAFVLYNKTISKKDLPTLINNINKKNLEVTLTFEKDGFQYKIVRSRKTKTKGDVQLLVLNKDGEFEDKTPDSIANTTQQIEKIIGIPFDVFSRIIVFSATFQPFLDLPSRHASQANQTGIMEELFGYTELTEKAETLKQHIKGVKSEFTHLEELQEQINQEITRHKAQIESAKQRIAGWDESHSDKIKATKQEIKELSSIDLDEARQHILTIEASKKILTELKPNKRVIETELKSLEDKVTAVAEKKEKIETVKERIALIEGKVDFDEEQEAIDLIHELGIIAKEGYDLVKWTRGEISKRNSAIKENDEKVEHLEDETCPYCMQTFTNTKEKITELTEQNDLFNLELDKIKEEQEEAQSKLVDSEEEMDSLKTNSMFNGNANELQEMRTKYERYQTQLKSYTEEELDENIDIEIDEKKGEILNLISAIDIEEDIIEGVSNKARFETSAELEKVSARLDSAKERLESFKKESNPHTETLDELKDVEFDNDKSDKLNELKDTLNHQEFLLKLLTKKDSFVRKNLLDRSLPFLNKRLMIYLEKLGLPHRVEFQPDMTAHISQFGTELEFSGLSSGQKARVNLALAFAFRDVLQARHGKVKFCMLDECLDTGLGNVGVQLAAQMIKDIATENSMSMFVISHRDEISNMFKNQMVVELKNGFSNITD